MRKLLLLLLPFSIVICCSCNKLDVSKSLNKNKSLKSVEEKFFSSNRTNDPIEQSLVNYLKNINNKQNFIEKTSNLIGYPRWDKTFIAQKKGNSSSAVSNVNDDSTTLFYIPFVRDSQNFVNASIIISASLNDTSFSYRMDWQYAQKQNSLSSITDSAEYYAIFFMFMDKQVFGNDEFLITDTNLFKTNNNNAVKIKFTNLTTNTNSSNLHVYSNFCQDVTLSYETCPVPGNCNGPNNTCDLCWRCVSIHTYSYCWGEWVYIDDGGSGPGGSGSGGGGCGACNGTNTPPTPCGGLPSVPFARGNVSNSNTNNINSPCNGGGGWTPLPSDEPPTILSLLYQSFSLSQKTWWNAPQNSIYRDKISMFIHSNPGASSNFNYIKELIDWVISDSTVTPTDLNYFLQVNEEGDGVYDGSYWENPNTVLQQMALPTLQQFTQNFPKITNPDGNITYMESSDVYTMIGDPLKSKYNQPNYINACAIRGSWAFNKIRINNTFPFRIPTGSSDTEYGANNLSYIVNAKGFNAFMRKRFGNPSHSITSAQLNGSRSALNIFLKNLRSQNIHGIYTLVTNGGNYSGHVDLMTFGDCLGGYALPESILSIEKIEIWQLH